LPEYDDRILGASQKVKIPTNVLFFLTGNNLMFSGDMPSRVIVARIEPDVERPEERTFKIADLRAHVLEHRIELVRAAMTILQAYFIAGRPPQNVKPYGRFEQWSHEIREAIIWAGLTDPCETREAVIATDPERDAALVVFTNWDRAFGDDKMILRKVIERAIGYIDHDANGEEVKVAGDDNLKAALLEVAADLENPHEISSRRLAAWCRKKTGRVIGEFKLSRGGEAAEGL
jgi:hypothetical protein